MKSLLFTFPILAAACGGGEIINQQDPEKVQENETETEESDDSNENDVEESNDDSDNPDIPDVDTDNSDEDEEEEAENDTDVPDSDSDENTLTFGKTTLFELPGSAWMKNVDLNGDGHDEYLISSMSAGLGDWPSFIGAGAAHILSRNAANPFDLAGWSVNTVFDRTFEIDWPNDSTFFDVNNDGIQDWVIGTGFIPLPNGGIIWMEGYIDANGAIAFDVPDYIETPWTDHFYHKAWPIDIDNDGDMDFVTTNHKNAEKNWLGQETAPGFSVLEWYENNGVTGQASFTHHEIANVGGALLTLHDVDGDGDADIILPQFFEGASLIWMENPGANGGSWIEHVINDTTGKGFDVELADMDGDGDMDLVYGNHNHQLSTLPTEQTMGIYWFEIPDASQVRDMANWNTHMNVVFEGFYVDETNADQNGAPGVFHTGDVDGDGMMDVSVSGDGDDGLYVFLQQDDGDFLEVLVDTGTIMGGDHHMADLDGDGDMDFLWAIYGEMDFLSGQLEPASQLNVYLQGEGESLGFDLNGNLNFEITTSFGPDTCNGTLGLNVDGSTLSGSYDCAFGVIGAQANAIAGTIDANGNVTGTIDVSVSFDGQTYTLGWTGTYDGSTLTCNTSDAAQLGSMDVTYVLDFTAAE